MPEELEILANTGKYFIGFVQRKIFNEMIYSFSYSSAKCRRKSRTFPIKSKQLTYIKSVFSSDKRVVASVANKRWQVLLSKRMHLIHFT